MKRYLMFTMLALSGLTITPTALASNLAEEFTLRAGIVDGSVVEADVTITLPTGCESWNDGVFAFGWTCVDGSETSCEFNAHTSETWCAEDGGTSGASVWLADDGDETSGPQIPVRVKMKVAMPCQFNCCGDPCGSPAPDPDQCSPCIHGCTDNVCN